MKPTGSIKKSGSQFLWTYQSDDLYLYGYADTMEEAQKALEEAGSRTEITMDTFFTDYYMPWKSDLKEPTKLKYHLLYQSRIQPVLGVLPLSSITPMQIEDLITHLVKDPNTSPLTASVVKGMLSSIFKRAYRMHFTKRNVFPDIEVPRNRKHPQERLAFTDEQLEEVLRRAEGSEFELIFKISAWTGMRQSEVTGLQVENIDFKDKLIRVRHSLECVDGEFILSTPKTETSVRNIPISEAHLQEIQRYIEGGKRKKRVEMVGDATVRTEDGTTPIRDFIFISRKGTPFIGPVVSTKMRLIVNKMKEEGLLDKDGCYSFHSLRHTFCSRSLRLGMSVKATATLLGHRDISMTQDHYNHIFPEDIKKQMRDTGLLDGPDEKEA